MKMTRRKSKASRKSGSLSGRGSNNNLASSSDNSQSSPDKSSNKSLSKSKQKGKITKRKQPQLMKCKLKGRTVVMTKALFTAMRKLQKSTNLLIPTAAFIRLVREIIQDYSQCSTFKLGSLCAQALQEAAETYIVKYLEDSYLCARHAKRVTLRDVDMRLIGQLRAE